MVMDGTSHQVKSQGSADGDALTTPHDLSLVPGTRVVEGDNLLLQGSL